MPSKLCSSVLSELAWLWRALSNETAFTGDSDTVYNDGLHSIHCVTLTVSPVTNWFRLALVFCHYVKLLSLSIVILEKKKIILT